MKYVISGPANPVQDTIYIPSSKSISNRVLIIHSLSGSASAIDNLSESDDTRLLQLALENSDRTKNINHAGTAMRFLIAYYATGNREVILTGSERMKERPVGPLVDVLRELGTGITYLEKEGYPPLKVSGGLKQGGVVHISGGVSSQFISALMMIGPVLNGGLDIILEGEVVSTTYIDMTLEIMRQCGVMALHKERKIIIPCTPYRMQRFSVESDWSAASYWYQIAAFLTGSEIILPWLTGRSLQGDAAIVELFRKIGVITTFRQEKAVLRSEKAEMPDKIEYDFNGCPDLVQTCAATLCALGIRFRFSGTRTLRVKETDRINALQIELNKLGFVLDADPGGEWMEWNGSRCEPETDPVIDTYHDHRMAMAFAPLAIPFEKITIDDPMVVTKSYPGFWADIQKAGFSL